MIWLKIMYKRTFCIINIYIYIWFTTNILTHILTHARRLVSRIRAPLAAFREPEGKLWQQCKVLYVFEHKTQYILIHAPFTRIVVFWHIGNVPANNFTFPERSQNVPPKPEKTFPCNVPITLKWKVPQTFMNVPQ